MRRKKIILALAALVIAFVLVVFMRKNPELRETPDSATKGLPGISLLVPTKQASIINNDFPPEAQAEIQNCLGETAPNFAALETLIGKFTGEQESDELEWKVAEFEDESGQHFRVRLAKEFTEAGKPHLTLSLFTVDAEGLPDRIDLPVSETQNPDLAALDRVLHNKRISSEIESHRYVYANDKELIREQENGVTENLTYAGGKIRLACASTAESPSCHCVR
ncbi:MAG: hypothetical protein ACXWQO_07805 [Bdellovibrionota bacterium]